MARAEPPGGPPGGVPKAGATGAVHHARCAPSAGGVPDARGGIDYERFNSPQAWPARRLPRGPRLAQAPLLLRGPGALRAEGHVGRSYAWRARMQRSDPFARDCATSSAPVDHDANKSRDGCCMVQHAGWDLILRAPSAVSI